MKNRLLTLLLAIGLVAACRPEQDAKRYYAELDKWRSDRVTRLTSDSSWLTLAGLHWFREGVTTIGSAEGNGVVITKKAPARVGTVTITGGQITLTPDPAAGVTIDGKAVTQPVMLLADADDGGPTVFGTGAMRYQMIRRGDRIGLRIKDPESDARKNFKGLEYFPVASGWIVDAKLEKFPEPRTIPITNIVGMTSNEEAPGILRFSVGGKEYALTPIIEKGETDYFIIFRDQTSGRETYPAGRYLYASPAGPDGIVRLDFNKAYNPPCAFTPFATCPLPPLPNRLAVRVEAGEKNFHH
jgi:uncharacterized protein (DUF1684 family)